jgi:hypothetical protein
MAVAVKAPSAAEGMDDADIRYRVSLPAGMHLVRAGVKRPGFVGGSNSREAGAMTSKMKRPGFVGGSNS